MKKDINYIIKRVFVGVLIALILMTIKSCNVKALANGSIVSDLIIPASSSEGIFVNLNNNEYSSKGYSLLTNGDILYAIPSTSNYTYGNSGGGIRVCNLSLLKDMYYSMTFYFASAVSSDYVHPFYTNYTNKLVITDNSGSTKAFDFNYISVSNGVQKGTYPGLTPVGDTIYSYTIIFKANSTGTCLTSAFSSSSKTLSSTELAFLGYTFESLGSQALTQQQMTSIIDSANQAVINNQDNNTQSIINNQNANTQQQIESEQVCFDYTFDINSTNKDIYNTGYLTSNGNITENSNLVYSDYIKINKNTYYNLNLNYDINNVYYCTYNSNKVLQSCFNYNNNHDITILTNFDGYVRFSASVRLSSFYTRFTGRYCGYGNQQISGQITDVQDKQDETNQQLKDLNNNITSEVGPNLGGLNNSAGWLPAGPVDSILNLPLSLFNNLSTSLGNTCQPVELPVPLVNSTIILPCMNTIYNDIGISTWVNAIGVIASAFILFSYLAKLYKWVDDTLTFRENNHIDNWGGV